MKRNYGVFILSYGRSDNVTTIGTLQRSGYTGKIHIVVDTSDLEIPKYVEKYGKENIVVFDKQEVKGSFDIMDNQSDDRCVVFARNKMWDIAKELGYEYFIVLDDDYTHFNFRFDKEYKYISSKTITDLDTVFDAMVEYVATTQVACISFAQGGDFMGGSKGQMARAVQTKRKIMNLFVFATNNAITYPGRLNEDVNAYLYEGIKGRILLTTTQVCLEQGTTQENKGGLTDIYLAQGTYVKSFYSVMQSPSSCKIVTMGNKFRRIHHQIHWNNTVPKIIREVHKKSILDKNN